jgi:hypothetical protein
VCERRALANLILGRLGSTVCCLHLVCEHELVRLG